MVSYAVANWHIRVGNRREFVSFHIFPRNQKLLHNWLDTVKRKGLSHRIQVKPWIKFVQCISHQIVLTVICHSHDRVKISLKPGSCPKLNLPRLGSTIRNPLSFEYHIKKVFFKYHIKQYFVWTERYTTTHKTSIAFQRNIIKSKSCQYNILVIFHKHLICLQT